MFASVDNETRATMGKWQKIDPVEIKVGDRVKLVDRYVSHGMKHRDEVRFPVRDVPIGGVNEYAALSEGRTWYVRRPKPAKPLTRPDEPPVGAFFRVDRTGEVFRAYGPQSNREYLGVGSPGIQRLWSRWDEITEPGDTITELVLVESQPTVMAMERES